MEKRAFIAVILSLLVLVGYQEWLSWRAGTPPPPSVSETKEAVKTDVAPQPATPPMAVPRVAAAPSSSTAATDVKVETDQYEALFTSQGARLKSFKFKKYLSSSDPKSLPFEIVSAEPGVALPLGVRWQTPTPFDDSGLVYTVQGGDLKLTGDAKGTLVFEGKSPDGTLITKKLTFTGSTYPIDLEVTVNPAEGGVVSPEILLTETSDHSVPNPEAKFEGYIASVDNKIKREPAAEIDKKVDLAGDVLWGGFGHTYFFVALLPQNGAQNKISLSHSGPTLTAAMSGPAVQPGAPIRYTLFVAPKELSTLESLGKGLEHSIDFGLFGFGSFFSIPCLYVLHFTHRFTHSYGIDIILLTVLIKLLLAPLTQKSYVSMKKMQKLQPQMERLKEKFSDDKEKLNKEIMELYRRNGVNPLGGCLPMVLQFPVFIGLYNALSTPIELRHAPFMWIKDLSRPDWQSLPFTLGTWHLGIPILTVLMGASMFLQQWMTPSAGDPNQKKMMMLMPLMFTFMFVSFPAGLTVYWLVNNLLSIAQQYWINRRQN
jgi:YidC/Oxa1 family membrane protein insertase